MISTNIFVINGYKTSGKDYLISAIRQSSKDLEDRVFSFSTVDLVKLHAEDWGYREDDKEKHRKFLSDYKDLVDKHFKNETVKEAYRRARNNSKHVCFIHSREPEKIDLIKELCIKDGLQVRTLFVTADWHGEMSHDNHADKNVENYDYDIVFDNTKDVKTFNKRVKQFIQTNIKL